MLKKINLFIIAISFLAFLMLTQKPAYAQSSCDAFGVTPSSVVSGDSFSVVKSDGFLPDNSFVIAGVLGTELRQTLSCEEQSAFCDENPTEIFTFDSSSLEAGQDYTVQITYDNGSGLGSCTTTSPLAVAEDGDDGRGFCDPAGLTSVSPQEGGDEDTRFVFEGCLGAQAGGSPCGGGDYVRITSDDFGGVSEYYSIADGGLNSCRANGTFTLNLTDFSLGIYNAQVYVNGNAVGSIIQFEVGPGNAGNVGDACTVRQICFIDGLRGERQCAGNLIRGGVSFSCELIEGGCGPCVPCGEGRTCLPPEVLCTGTGASVYTAIGCIPFGVVGDTARFFITWGLGIGGGIALALLIYASIQYLTSRGNPKQVNSAKSLFWAAISGILFLALAVFLLEYIGVSVLGLFA